MRKANISVYLFLGLTVLAFSSTSWAGSEDGDVVDGVDSVGRLSDEEINLIEEERLTIEAQNAALVESKGQKCQAAFGVGSSGFGTECTDNLNCRTDGVICACSTTVIPRFGYRICL